VLRGIALGAAIVMGAAGAAAQEVSLEGVENVRRATVLIHVGGEQGSAGSGFILSDDGVIATAAHVLAGASEASVRLASGEEFPVLGLVAVDEKRDMALLRIAGFGLPTVSLGNSDSVEVGQRLVAIGAPLGLESTVSDGLLSGIRLSEGIKVFQISAPVSPGSSGGPIATEQGNVVGFVVSGIIDESAQNLNFALPINYLRGYLGIASAQAPTSLADWEWSNDAIVRGNPVSAARTVNDSLDVDWRVLDGLEVFHEEKGDGGRRIETELRYSIGTDDDGAEVLEYFESRLFRQTGNILSQRHGAEFFRQNGRTLIALDSREQVTSFVEIVPLHASLEHLASEGMIEMEGDELHYDSAGIDVRQPVERGVLPANLIETIIATLPESLPAELRVWVLDDEFEVVPVKIEFGARESLDVPFVRGDAHCDKDAKTTKIRSEVIRVTYTRQAHRVEGPFLVWRPHVAVPEGTKCVRFPGMTF
jgi:hypothetical protein